MNSQYRNIISKKKANIDRYDTNRHSRLSII